MSDEIKQYLQPGKKNLILIYVFYLIGFMVPVFSLVGAAFAYANKEDSNEFLRNHYIFALRTFIFGIIFWFVAFVSFVIYIGIIIYPLVFVWFFVRSIIALQYVIQELPHPNPLTFWIK